MFAQTTSTAQAVATTAECPECAGTVAFNGKTLKGEIVTCPDCGAELEVTGVNPITLDLAPKEEEDWGE
ncbi:MAG TPA: lysine biosynthesis protein LysW [Anaerolineae bacterium]|nr:lysine biosynthesis protein LysW [Anaerolineae bacterium]HZQ09662.1 lysine biosynthesis protein LysW [Anaerolineae bacterium]